MLCLRLTVALAPGGGAGGAGHQHPAGAAQLVLRYLDNVGAAPLSTIRALFGWDPAVLQRTVDELCAAGDLREVRVPDLPEAMRGRPVRRAGAVADVWLTARAGAGPG